MFCESCKGMKDEGNTAEGPALPGMCSGQKLCAQSLPVSDARGARKTTVMVIITSMEHNSLQYK